MSAPLSAAALAAAFERAGVEVTGPRLKRVGKPNKFASCSPDAAQTRAHNGAGRTLLDMLVNRRE